MKKMNILLTALSLAVAMLTPMASFAEGTPDENVEKKTFKNGSETMVVSQEYDSEYTIIIPEGTQKLEEGLEVGAEALLKYNEKLVVSVASNNGWLLKDSVYGENNADISYTLTVGNKEVAKDGTADIFEVNYDDDGMENSVVMKLSDIDEPTYAGTYIDTLTFSARMESVTGTTSESNAGT